jgi:hypothetical protein
MQCFATGVADIHGQTFAQYPQAGDLLFANNLPACAHGIGAVRGMAASSTFAKETKALHLAALESRLRLEPCLRLSGNYQDLDLVLGWSPANAATSSSIELQGSLGKGLLERLEHRQQYQVEWVLGARLWKTDVNTIWCRLAIPLPPRSEL